ncbi:putative metallophosphoesterase [Peptococcaceae bacterium CEB3]|nr:putative metallophosphoesterase [Peptococcaceae bacterium CEB3]
MNESSSLGKRASLSGKGCVEALKGIRLLLYSAAGISFALYAGLCYYVGLRGWQFFFSYLPLLPPTVYWIGFWIVAMAYLAGRLGERVLPETVGHILNVIGSYWLGIMFYALLVLAAVDLMRGLNDKFRFSPHFLSRGPWLGWAIFLVLLGLVLYGLRNARHPIVNHYNLTIGKKAGSLGELHIVLISDIHLGAIMNNGRLAELVESVNALKPDLVLLGGDVIDENVERVIRQDMRMNLSRLQAPFGVYAVLGNHEYLGGHVREALAYMAEAGVHMLRDSSVKVADSFYLVGRDDRSARHFTGRLRRPLADLLEGLDRSLPVIVLDHQPSHLEEAERAGVDLQLSGHTHKGQLFPIQLLTRRLFADDFGLLEKDDFRVIVSSGFGTWGPPLRVGNRPEIVEITVRFGP